MKPPLFIVGCPRSGTTLLRLILNSHSNVAIPGETYYLPSLYKAINSGMVEDKDSLYNFIVNSPVFREIGVSKEKLHEEIFTSELKDISVKLAVGHISYMKEQGKSRWGDKTPEYLKFLPLLKGVFPEANIIHIIRDGRDVSVSILENKFLGPKNICDAAYLWKSRVEKGREDGRRIFGDKYIEIIYEDLVDNPVKTIQYLCDRIDERFEDEMLKYFESANKHILPDYIHHNSSLQPIDQNKVNKWKKILSKTDIRIFSLIAGKTLKTFNYEDNSRINLIAIIILWIYKLNKFSGRVYRFIKRKLNIK